MSDLHHVIVPLTPRELAYLQERAAELDVAPGRVFQMALRIYQLWQRYPELASELERLMDAETGPSPGCGGDDDPTPPRLDRRETDQG